MLPELARFVERVLGEETMARMLAEVARAASPPKNKPGGGGLRPEQRQDSVCADAGRNAANFPRQTSQVAGRRIGRLLADKGYDAEWIHRTCREEHGIESWIAPVIHRKDGRVGGRWRQHCLGRIVPPTSDSAGRSKARPADSNDAWETPSRREGRKCNGVKSC